ncbi:hypothetical protein MSPP1_000027 [Malassezia sp. CBS 17886]|nr:hypothetical protein MSPP1_000027 [Malassezia sp. CBS 17886]
MSAFLRPAMLWRPCAARASPMGASGDSLADPDGDTALFYHPRAAGIWAISHLSEPPRSPTSPEVIAQIRPSVGVAPHAFLREHPDAAELNPAFWDALHTVLQRQVPHDEMVQFEADLRHDGWAHLCDERNFAMPGRTQTPDNILASVAFTDKHILFETYSRNDMYRFCIGSEGPMKLPERWLSPLRDYLVKM